MNMYVHTHCVPCIIYHDFMKMIISGSIFTTKKLQNRQDNMFSTVFGDRVARTASPSACQTCYCSSAGVECFDCEYPRYESRLEEASRCWREEEAPS